MVKDFESVLVAPVQRENSSVVVAARIEDSRRTDGLIVEAYPERANLYALSLDPIPPQLYQSQREVNRKTRVELHFDALHGRTAVPPGIANVRRALQTAVLEA